MVSAYGRSEHRLIAQVPIEVGETILMETPLVAVRYDSPSFHRIAWVLADHLQADRGLLDRYYGLRLKVTKFPMDGEDRRVARFLSKRYGRPLDVINHLYFGLATNNMAYVDANRNILGHGIFEMLSRSNHSCAPNSIPQPGDVEAKGVALVAVAPIAAGEEICWNYADTEEFLAADSLTRRRTLYENFRFDCRCHRCLLEFLQSRRDFSIEQGYESE